MADQHDLALQLLRLAQDDQVAPEALLDAALDLAGAATVWARGLIEH